MAAYISSLDFQLPIRSGHAPLVIDVRRRAAFRAAIDMIVGALWRDPELVASWAAELPSASKGRTKCTPGIQRPIAKVPARGLSTTTPRRTHEL